MNEYMHTTDATPESSDYLWPVVSELISGERPSRIFELGCGNGATAKRLLKAGYNLIGVDPSESGIALARAANPGGVFDVGSAYDDLASRYGHVDVVLSLEVIEHVYYPRQFAKTVNDLLRPGGLAILSTPYHGYIKNLALAISGRMDSHFTALWDGGHIKFWSESTLRQLLEEAGFEDIGFRRAGRIPPVAKSMIAIARKPH